MSARKRYRPKGVSADSWKIAIQGSCLLSKADQYVRVNLLSDASELADLRGLVETWCDVLSTVTHAEYFQAEERTHQRLKAILSSKTPGVRVVEVV